MGCVITGAVIVIGSMNAAFAVELTFDYDAVVPTSGVISSEVKAGIISTFEWELVNSPF